MTKQAVEQLKDFHRVSAPLTTRYGSKESTPETPQQSANFAGRGKRRDKIADALDVTTGSWQVTCFASEKPNTPTAASTYRFVVRTLLRSLLLGGVGCLAIAVLVDVARPAAAAKARRAGGVGTATASVVNFSEAARSPDARTAPPANPRIEEFYRRTRPVRPSRPTSGAREVPPTAAAPQVAPTVSSNFDGISEAACGTCGVPPDPNAATSGTEIVEVVNTFIQVTDATGAIKCGGGVTLNRLLRSTDSLTDPRVQFDNVHQRFSLAVTVAPASKTATPAMWVAASDSADACGTWRVYRLTFSGSPFPAGTFLDFPMLGQDTNALLIFDQEPHPHQPELHGVRPAEGHYLCWCPGELQYLQCCFAHGAGHQRRPADDLQSLQLFPCRGTRHRLPALPTHQ
jgi:hypothetical protein